MDANSPDSVSLATELTIAWLSNTNTRAAVDDVPAFLRSMHEAVLSLSNPAAAAPADVQEEVHEPAVTARKSLSSPDHIISMINGKPYRALKRHLTTNGLTPAEYRERYNLKSDYPMVAPTYAQARREIARQIGLGQGRKSKAERTPAPVKAAKKPKAAKAPVEASKGE
ncbi:MucR family transcriptional regulator [Sphingomonas sp. PB4P5]|uniref:MucR family transcriptional regulator n=1 Tax=Parasphingomonas puruogangriensis TaxID=3096155 RepID=UPI002FC75B51